MRSLELLLFKNNTKKDCDLVLSVFSLLVLQNQRETGREKRDSENVTELVFNNALTPFLSNSYFLAFLK